MPDPIELPGWLKWLLKKVLIWLAKRAYEKLVQGMWVKIELKGDVIHIYIKLEDNPPPIVDYLHL